MDIKATHIGTANPAFKLCQQGAFEFLRCYKQLSQREEALYKRFLSDKGIGYRYFFIDRPEDLFEEDQDLVIERFQEAATCLSASSVEKCLKEARISKDEVKCLVVSTCTGYLCPGLTSYIIEKTALKPDIFSLDIVGMGCGGAMPALQACRDYLSIHENTYALAVSTEICSSALFWQDEPGLVLSNSIFADGSAACLLTNKDNESGLKILDFESRIEPNHRDMLRFRTENAKLKNVIKEAVPAIAADLTKEIARRLLERNSISPDAIKFWALHPGGRKVIDKIQEVLDLKPQSMDHSRKVLYNYGNMSSPTVLYVLKEILQGNSLNRDDLVFMASFGAGFSGYGGILKYV